MISLFWPVIYKEEWLNELEDSFSTRWIGEGPKTKKFEEKFGEKFGYDYCLSVNSGTSALELAYHLADIQEDDEVIVTVLTCSATSIPLIRRKAKIIFTDIDNNLTMDYEDLKSKITDKTKAVITVNLGGIQCDERIYKLLKEKGITSIIDCCQSLGIQEHNGDYLAYSFQAIKHFSCGDGGMFVARNKDDYVRAKKLRWFGIDRELKIKNNWKCYDSNREICMDMDEAGYKFHMNDITASMGMVGLKHSDEILEHRKMIADTYNHFLNVECIYGGSCWLFCIMVENKFNVIDKLRIMGIESDVAHLRNDAFTLFGGRWKLKNMDEIEKYYMYLPIHPNITKTDAMYIASTVNDIMNGNE